MDDEIQLISDGDGLAIVGEPASVDRFLVSEGLLARSVELPRLGTALRAGAVAAHVGSMIGDGSGRWLKLTEESAQVVKKFGLTDTKTPGVSHAMAGKPGSITAWLQVAKGPGSLLTNPAVLANAAGVMAQLSMQQAMNEITDYLAAIDEKVDDVLRAQKDAVLARMIGAGAVVDEALTTRQHGGRVNEVTWSKVQATPGIVAETQAYALRRLDALAERVEREKGMGGLADAVRDAGTTASEWLAVLARSFQLQDAIAVIELDRVLEAAPDDLDGHRLGLKAARQDRVGQIVRSLEQFTIHMDAAAARANAKVLLHPIQSREVVHSRNQLAQAVGLFLTRLGVDGDHPALEARRWADAAIDVRSKVLETGAGGVDAARRLGGGTVDHARSVRGQVARRLADRPHRRDDEADPET